MISFHKYVRTPHIRGSRLQHGDHDLEAVPWEELVGKHLVIEEKLDGANSGISFNDDGELLLQSRGHYLRGGPRERHFDLLKQWSACHSEVLARTLGTRYVMYGEWMYAKHTIFYDALPHYFMEFDILDTETNMFLSTPKRRELIIASGASNIISSVKVLRDGPIYNLKNLVDLIATSNFITDPIVRRSNLNVAAIVAGVQPEEAAFHTDMSPLMEGLYVKWEDDDVVKWRYKYVRATFTNAILEQETHWHDRPIIQNGLVPGGLERMFTQ